MTIEGEDTYTLSGQISHRNSPIPFLLFLFETKIERRGSTPAILILSMFFHSSFALKLCLSCLLSSSFEPCILKEFYATLSSQDDRQTVHREYTQVFKVH